MGRKKTCLRCGKCCFVNLIAYAEKEDFERWRKEKRLDIIQTLERGHPIWAGDRIISVDTGFFAHFCPFLQNDGSKFRCAIYETRPRVCRDYVPGSSEICPRWSGHEKKGVKT